MIVFDLRCGAQGHVFEAWFGSGGDYEAQRARGLVSCPICGSGEIEKAPMTPSVGAKGNSKAEPAPAAVKAALVELAKTQKKALENSQHVGPRFADEARAIHLGEAEARSIHGEATPAQAHALREEGIPVAPLPFPVAPPEREN